MADQAKGTVMSDERKVVKLYPLGRIAAMDVFANL